MKSNYDALPSLSHDSAHHLVVTALARLRQTQVEGFLARYTGSHAAAIFLREVLYWLMPSKAAPERPRSTVYRNGHHWMARTQKDWYTDHGFTRTQLETAYGRCEDLIEIEHFMFGRQRQTHYRIKFEKMYEAMEQDEVLQACLQSDLDAAKSRKAPCANSRNAVCGNSRTPSLHSLGDSFNPLADTGCARACAFVSPPGAAAPEPPPDPPARSLSGIEAAEASLEEPEAKPAVTGFRQAQAILQAGGVSTHDKFQQARRYEDRTRRALNYLLIWQGVCKERLKQDYRFSEAHWVQALDLAEREETSPAEFYRTLAAAWTAEPCAGYDPLFMCSHHSRKLTSFLKHFRRMADELDQQED